MAQDLILQRTVALIDDDASIQRAVGRLLRIHGYFCVTYDSGEAALESPGLLKASCALVDIRLKGMSGFDISDRLDALGVALPRVFITAHPDMDSPKRRGTRLLLVKPFEELEMIDSIKSSMVI